MEQEKKKSPDKRDGAKKAKAYENLAVFLLILGIICAVLKEHELYQDFAIGGILLDLIAVSKKIN
ncbi:hypothetical protein [uncultured Ruminococcus sp.]|uniref:hypothetical protein n=1 Tax=uncultured Ruminococcus sp. TaxID=165186 RepID=UPI0025CE1656|nr:hypothetical protein [uncultured Ruminococcus sp.]